MKKKVCIVLLAICFLFGMFAGCQQQTDDDLGGADASTVVLWCNSVMQPAFFNEAKIEFEKKYAANNWKIIVKPQSSSQLGASLDATLGTDGGPDMVTTIGGLVMPTLIKGKRVVDLNDIMSPIENQLVDGAITNKYDSSDGHYYAAPFQGFVAPIMYYNKSLIEKIKAADKDYSEEERASLEKEVPETYDDLKNWITAAKKYDPSLEGIVAGFNTAGASHFMQAITARTMTAENYKKLMQKDPDENPYEDPGFAEGFNLLKRYKDDGLLHSRITGFDNTTAATEFYNQKALIYSGENQNYRDHVSGLGSAEIGVFALPKEQNNLQAPQVNATYSEVIAINAKSEKQDICKEFIKFILSKDMQDKLAKYNMLPALKNAEISEMNELIKPLAEKIQEEGCADFYQTYSFQGCDSTLVNVVYKILSQTNYSAQEAQAVFVEKYAQEFMQK